MKEGKALDMKIHRDLFNKPVDDPLNIPPYSTDVFASHAILEAFKHNNWNCFVNAVIANDGTLVWKVKVRQRNKFAQRVMNTLPHAVCMIAIDIMEGRINDSQKDETENHGAEFSGTNLNSSFTEVTDQDSSFVAAFTEAIRKKKTVFKNKKGHPITFFGFAKMLYRNGLIKRDEMDLLGAELSRVMVEFLSEHNLKIVPRDDDEIE